MELLSRRRLLALSASMVAAACSSRTDRGVTDPSTVVTSGSAPSTTGTSPAPTTTGFSDEVEPITTEYDPLEDSSLDGAVPYEGSTNPFMLGVASGDPTAFRIVLWTRLAPVPLAANGGMDLQSYRVDWEVALDEAFADVVFTGTARADAESAHSVHVDLSDLEPSVTFFYRFRAGDHVSAIGRTQSMPLLTQPDAWTIAVLAGGPPGSRAPIYRDIVEATPELIVFAGSYADNGPHASVEDARIAHAAALVDEDLQSARASSPWLAHRSVHPPRTEAEARAWWEHMPVRLPQSGEVPSGVVGRRSLIGSLADVLVLDPRTVSPDATTLDRQQQQWLADEAASTEVVWRAIVSTGFPGADEDARTLLRSLGARNVLVLADGSTGAAPSWIRHSVTPEIWTTTTRTLNPSSGRITDSAPVTLEAVLDPDFDPDGEADS